MFYTRGDIALILFVAEQLSKLQEANINSEEKWLGF